MRNSTGPWLVVIAAVTILALFLVIFNPTIGSSQVKAHYGLDIQGGLSVLLRADPGADTSNGKLDLARQIIERRVDALGVSEPVVQIAGSDEIVVELPGITDPQAAINTVKQTGLLEFVNFSQEGCQQTATMPAANQYILTTKQVSLLPGGAGTPTATTVFTPLPTLATATLALTPSPTPTEIQEMFKIIQVQSTEAATLGATPTPVATTQATAAATAVGTAQAAGTGAATAAASAQAAGTAQAAAPGAPGTKGNPLKNPCTGAPFTTVMTGAGLTDAEVQLDPSKNQWVVAFTLAGNDESNSFVTFTQNNINQPMAIVLDGQVLSAPVIQQAITSTGQISGNFTKDSANELALQLRYGSLPVPLHVEATQEIGASLGSESIQASVRAGIVGILAVLLFMIVYYRVAGFAAALALLLFAVINLALYEVIPVTLTLPAIVGFLISTGAAVDGNILIFERSKEELRAGRPLMKAIELGFSRAWPSIRDSNISTIMVGLILYFFGSQFGASAVRGFAVTLILGLVTNLFTAIIVTRTLLNAAMTVAGEAMHRTRLFG